MKNGDQDTLEIISHEIEELKAKSKKDGLSFSETKKLETLTKIKALIFQKPTSIVKNINDDEFSDEEVLKFLKDNIKDGQKKKISRKKHK